MIKSLKKIIIGLILFFMVVPVIYGVLFLFPIGSKLSSGINQEKILSLKIGMLESDVIKILGNPLLRKVGTTDGKNITLVYGISGILGAGPDIEVIIKNKKVNLIILEFLDASFYYCSADNCPGIGELFWFNWYIPRL